MKHIRRTKKEYNKVMKLWKEGKGDITISRIMKIPIQTIDRWIYNNKRCYEDYNKGTIKGLEKAEYYRQFQKRWYKYNPKIAKINRMKYYNKNKDKMRLLTKKWIRDNPDKVRRLYKNYFFKKFGENYETYDTLFKQQKGRCAICNNKETSLKKGKVLDLSFDHNHTTNKSRALLCHKCNVALGLLYEDINIMRKMIRYVKKWNKK